MARKRVGKIGIINDLAAKVTALTHAKTIAEIESQGLTSLDARGLPRGRA